MNYLEELMQEWLKYKGWIILDVGKRIGKRDAGGYDGELDVVAYNPAEQIIWHVECSMDADSWEKREARFGRKFLAGRQHIPELYKHLIPAVVPLSNIRQTVLFGAVTSKEKRPTVGGAEVMLVKDLLATIATELKGRQVLREAVPECFPILRTVQYLMDRQAGLGLELSGQLQKV